MNGGFHDDQGESLGVGHRPDTDLARATGQDETIDPGVATLVRGVAVVASRAAGRRQVVRLSKTARWTAATGSDWTIPVVVCSAMGAPFAQPVIAVIKPSVWSSSVRTSQPGRLVDTLA